MFDLGANDSIGIVLMFAFNGRVDEVAVVVFNLHYEGRIRVGTQSDAFL